MDLLTAVAVSLSPRVADQGRPFVIELRQAGHEITLELLLDAIRIRLGGPQRHRFGGPRVSTGGAGAASWSTAWNHSHGSSLAIRPCSRVCRPAACAVDQGGRNGLDATGGRKSSDRELPPRMPDRWPAAWRGAGRAGDGRGERSGERVDSAAHEGCLAADGATIAVLGSGLDRVYPAEHSALSRNISVKAYCSVN